MISKRVSARLKKDMKIFLKKIRTRTAIVIIENYNYQTFNSLKTLYNATLANEDSNEKILNNEKKKKEKIDEIE